MTFYGPDDLMMVSMDRFKGLTSAVDCYGDDGSMSLTFKSEKAFNLALQEWSYINEHDDGKFLLIANHDGCGPDDERAPYIISNIVEDPAALTTHLTAQSVPWGDVASSYDLDFGHVALQPNAQHIIKPRDDHGNWEKEATKTFDLSRGTPGKKIPIWNDTMKLTVDGTNLDKFILSCVDCYTAGTFSFSLRIRVHHFFLEEFFIGGYPKGLVAKFVLGVDFAISKKAKLVNQLKKQIFSFAVPDLGATLGEFGEFGVMVNYSVGLDVSFSGSGTIDFGVEASVPDSAEFGVHYRPSFEGFALGWEDVNVDPIFDVKNLTATMTVGPFSTIELKFGLKLKEVGDISVGIPLTLPSLTFTPSFKYDESGACSHDEGASKTGINFLTQIGMQVDARAGAQLKHIPKKWNPSTKINIWKQYWTLNQECYDFGFDHVALNSTEDGKNLLGPPRPELDVPIREPQEFTPEEILAPIPSIIPSVLPSAIP
ncbi:hypothetical protein ACLMJK_003643 [Lecanora helva]